MSALRRKPNPEPHTMTISGRLLEVNWKDGTAELHSPLRTVRLEFGREQADDLRQFANRYVEVDGVDTAGDGGETRGVRVCTLREATSDEAFWHPRPAAELAEEQGVESFKFDAAPSERLSEEELDEFLGAIFGDRYRPVR